MAVIGGLILAVLIATGGYFATRAVVGGVAEAIARKAPAPARKRAAEAGSRARATVVEPVRHIKARAMADVRATDWLERKRAKRAAAALRPPRERRGAMRRLVTPKGAPDVLSRPQATQPAPRPAHQSASPPPVAVNGTAPSPARHLSAVPQSPTGNGRTSPVTTNGTSAGGGYGAGADMLTSVQHLCTHVQSGGIQAKQRGYSVMSESFDYMAEQFTSLANRMSEPGQNYPASAWEPWLIVAAHLKAAATASGEGASVVQSIRSMTVGELAESSVKAPHHEELNKA